MAKKANGKPAKTKGRAPSRRPRPAKRTTVDVGELREIEAMLKNVNCGKTTVAIGATVKRLDAPEGMSLDEADALLVNARLEVELSVEPDQRELFEAVGIRTMPKVTSVADVHRASFDEGNISFRLAFRTDDVDLPSLAKFAGKNGTLRMRRVGRAQGADEAALEDPTQGAMFKEETAPVAAGDPS